jgi:hypothetical protein
MAGWLLISEPILLLLCLLQMRLTAHRLQNKLVRNGVDMRVELLIQQGRFAKTARANITIKKKLKVGQMKAGRVKYKGQLLAQYFSLEVGGIADIQLTWLAF